MRSFIILLILVIFRSFTFAQINITSDDMPSADDIIKLSVMSNNSIDVLSTGENFYWDFSFLQYNTQTADTFVAIIHTNVAYVPVFTNPFDTNKASLAFLQPDQTQPNPQIQITDSYDFYKKKTTNYAKSGFGAKINNVPTPIKYDVPELYYSFPLTYNHCDSSLSKFGLSVPTFGYYGQTIKRVNHVDGWGILKTPYGEFEVLRVVSVVNVSDTMFRDSWNFGFRINRAKLTEYKWIGKGHGLPLLQISKQTPGAYQIRYIDSTRITVDVDTYEIKKQDFIISPNPSTGMVTINKNIFDDCLLEIKNLQGISIFKSYLKNNFTHIDLSSISKGLYILTITTKSKTFSEKLILQ